MRLIVSIGSSRVQTTRESQAEKSLPLIEFRRERITGQCETNPNAIIIHHAF